MKAKVFLLLALFGIAISCQQKKQTGSPELLKQVLFGFYDGIENRDYDKIKEAVTTDFILFEDGKVWTFDSLTSAISSYPPYKADYSFKDFKFDMDNSWGCMRYSCHADFVVNDTLNIKFDWIESATFTKESGQWKMNFLHSTTRKLQ